MTSGPARPTGSQGKTYSVFHVKFDSPAARAAFQKSQADTTKSGTFVFCAFDCFADVFVDHAREKGFLAAVQQAGGWADSDGDTFVPPPRIAVAKGKPKSVPEQIFRGDPQLGGQGVIVALVDSGIDFRHEDFIRVGPGNQKTSRILYFWDTTRQAPASGRGAKIKSEYLFPSGEPIGTIYTQDELTAELNAGPTDQQILATDTNGHGTACAGIAAGNGSINPDLIGVAPAADIIAVRVGTSGENFFNAYLLNAAVGWIDALAGSKCAVISCSFGGQYGTHDGQMVDELQLSARFPLTRPGRAICVAAGNEGQDFIHAEIPLSGTTQQAPLKWTAAHSGRINLYFNTDAVGAVDITGTGFKVVRQELNRITHQAQAEVRFKGSGQLQIVRKGNQDLLIDAYIVGDGAEFVEQAPVLRKQVGTPGTSFNSITVGSYDWNDVFTQSKGKVLPLRVQRRDTMGWSWDDMTIGNLSSYSSPGPSRLVRRGDDPKPDIVSPGQYFIAPCSATIPAGYDPDMVRTDDGKYRDFNGTSAATPYTAGVMALLFQAKPTLSLGDIKALLRKHATAVPDMQKRPECWGLGKLDRQAVLRILEELQPQRANN